MKHETREAKAKKFSKITQVQTRVEITFFSIFKEVETLGKNGGVSSHTWQLQEKI